MAGRRSAAPEAQLLFGCVGGVNQSVLILVDMPANAILRSFFGCAFPIFGVLMFVNLGYHFTCFHYFGMCADSIFVHEIWKGHRVSFSLCSFGEGDWPYAIRYEI